MAQDRKKNADADQEIKDNSKFLTSTMLSISKLKTESKNTNEELAKLEATTTLQSNAKKILEYRNILNDPAKFNNVLNREVGGYQSPYSNVAILIRTRYENAIECLSQENKKIPEKIEEFKLRLSKIEDELKKLEQKKTQWEAYQNKLIEQLVGSYVPPKLR